MSIMVDAKGPSDYYTDKSYIVIPTFVFGVKSQILIGNSISWSRSKLERTPVYIFGR